MIQLTDLTENFIYIRDGEAVVKISTKPDTRGYHSVMVDMLGHNEVVYVPLGIALPRALAIIANVRAKSGERVA